MTDLLIINPAAAHGIYGPLGDDLIAVEPPLWCRLVAGYCRDMGHEVAILDAEAMRLDAKAGAAKAAEINALLYVLAVYGHQPSASTQQMWGAGELAREMKALGLGPIMMIGGHPSALPARTLEEEAIDYVGIGEGHLTVEVFLDAIKECGPKYVDLADQIPGLAYRDRVSGNIHTSPRALLAADGMKELHGHVWDLLPMDLYRAHNWHCFDDLSKRQPYASIYTSLGCPYKCTFCCINAPFDSTKYRMRTPETVVDEIEYLLDEYGIGTIKITDEMFILNERHYAGICAGILDRGLGQHLNMWAYSRVDTVKPEMLKLLRTAGIRWLALGIESGSKHVRDGAKKNLRGGDIIKTVRDIQNAGINVIGNFMFGLRDDDQKTMVETIDLALCCLPDFANFYCTMAYPGSALYTQAVKEGWTLPSSWRGYSQHNDDCRPLDTEHLTGAEVLDFRDHAFNEFFTHPDYLCHVRDKFGVEARAHVEKMTSYILKRKLLEGAA